MASGAYKQKQSNCRPKNPCLLIRKLVDLMEHPISQNATERHLQLLNDFLNASHYAFFLQDIPYIIRLYEMIAKKIEKIPQFKEPLECLLYFSNVRPMLTKISDQMEYVRDFQEYFSTLGYLILCLHDNSLSKSVLNAIIGLLENKPVGYCCVPHEYVTNAVEKSKLPEIFGQLLQVINAEVYPSLLEAMLLTCDISEFVCKTIAHQNAIEYLLRRLEPSWYSRNEDFRVNNPTAKDNIIHIENTCCILWKLLNGIETEKHSFTSPTMAAFVSLQYALRWCLVCPGHRKDRNNLTALILKLFDTFDTVTLEENELMHDLAMLAVIATGHVSSTQMYFTEDDIDFQFKKIIWTCLYYFKGDDIDQIIKEHEMVTSLLKYLFGERITGPVSQVQYCNLVKIIIKLIPKILTISINQFICLKGAVQIVKMIKNYPQSPYDIEILEAYLYCAHKCLLLQNERVTEAFNEACLFTAVTSVCKKILEAETLTIIHQKCLARCFCILQTISDGDSAYFTLILDLCICYLNRVIHPSENDPALDVKVTVCVLHLVWDAVSTLDIVHKEFVKKGGTYVVLDIAEISTFPVKSLALGILADLCRRSFCIPYLITWRKRGQKLLPMLMEIFRGQTEKSCYGEEKLQFSSEKIDNPWVALCRGKRSTFQNYCVTDAQILKSCRGKVHAILYAVKVKYKEKVETANTYYRLYSEQISTDDKLTMVFAANFMSLSMCKIWVDINKELKKEGIVPVEADLEILNEKINRIGQWKSYLKHSIENILRKEMDQDIMEEYEIYIQLNEARLSDALDALNELRFVSNCTERMFQINRKLRLSQELELRQKDCDNYHRTLLDLPFANVFNQTINIDSNTVYKTEEEMDILPVSPNRSEPFEIEYSDGTISERILEC